MVSFRGRSRQTEVTKEPTLKKQKILVTGGAGFIGSAMVRSLLGMNFDVVVLDALTYAAAGGWDNISEAEFPHVERIKGDVCDMDVCVAACHGCWGVIHMAAESHVTRSEQAPEHFRLVNVKGTENVLKAARHFGVERIVHMSTDEVYGPAVVDQFFREDEKLPGIGQATSPYAQSKAIADETAIMLAQAGAPVMVVRSTNAFGPRQDPEKMMPRSITRLLQNEKVQLWTRYDAEGKMIEDWPVRDWLYVDDACSGILTVLLKGEIGEVYNIGANLKPELSNFDITRMLIENIYWLGANDWIEFVDFVRDPRPMHDRRYGVNTDKITVLGWRPRTSFIEGLKKTVAWYTKNSAWWQNRVRIAEELYRQDKGR